MTLLDDPILASPSSAMAVVESLADPGDHDLPASVAGAGHQVVSPPVPAPRQPAHEGGRPRRSSTVSRQNPESVLLLSHLQRMAQGGADGGQHTALAGCYDLMGPVVFSLAVRMLRDRPAAEDVTQDIFIQVWRQAANYDTTRGSPEAWIMMIARTRILDRLRSRSAGIILKPVGDNLPDAPDAEDWPEDLAISREHAASVRHALAELPHDQRHAIELAFFDGLTHVEISDKLGVPLGTIKTRIRLGLLKIRDRLQEIIGIAPEPRPSHAAIAESREGSPTLNQERA